MHVAQGLVTVASLSTSRRLALGLRLSKVAAAVAATSSGKGCTNSLHRKNGSRGVSRSSVDANNGLETRDTCVVSAALNFLESKKRIVEDLRPEDYTAVDIMIGASVGAHVRHSLDHFVRCLAVLNNTDQDESDNAEAAKESIRYDYRERGGTVETDPVAAVKVMSCLLKQLHTLPRGSAGSEKLRGMVVAPAFLLGEGGASAAGDQEHQFTSNFERELFFCCHHGIHHDAMIRLILKRMVEGEGEATEVLFEKGWKDLGLAPSTVDFRQRQQDGPKKKHQERGSDDD